MMIKSKINNILKIQSCWQKKMVINSDNTHKYCIMCNTKGQ